MSGLSMPVVFLSKFASKFDFLVFYCDELFISHSRWRLVVAMGIIMIIIFDILSFLHVRISFVQMSTKVVEIIYFLKSWLIQIFTLRFGLRLLWMNSHTIICLFRCKSSHEVFVTLLGDWFIVTSSPLLVIISPLPITEINHLRIVSRVLNRHLVSTIWVYNFHISQFLNKWFSRFITNNTRGTNDVIILFRMAIKVFLLFLELIKVSETVWGQINQRAFFMSFCFLILVSRDRRNVSALWLIRALVLTLIWLIVWFLVHGLLPLSVVIVCIILRLSIEASGLILIVCSFCCLRSLVRLISEFILPAVILVRWNLFLRLIFRQLVSIKSSILRNNLRNISLVICGERELLVVGLRHTADLFLGFKDVTNGMRLSSSTLLIKLATSDGHTSFYLILRMINNFIDVTKLQIGHAILTLICISVIVLVVHILILESTNFCDFLRLSRMINIFVHCVIIPF